MTSYTKFALLLASDYPATRYRLRGCVNDANAIRSFLINSRGFAPNNIVTIYDRAMTRAAILTAFDQLVARSRAIAATGATPAFFLHYSGHGLRLRQNGDQRAFRETAADYNDMDGDEAIVPYDVDRAGVLRDDLLNARLIKPLHPATQLFVLTDCCNSGTNLDLPYKGLTRISDDPDLAASIVHLAGSQDWQLSSEVNGMGLTTKRFLEVIGSSAKSVATLRAVMGDLSLGSNIQHPQVSVSKASLVDGSLFPWLVGAVRTSGTGGGSITGKKDKRELSKAEETLSFLREARAAREAQQAQTLGAIASFLARVV